MVWYRAKEFLQTNTEHFLQKFEVFIFLCFPSAFFWYAKATQLFLIRCLLKLKCFPFNLISLLADLLSGPETSISPLESLSSSGCTNSWAKILCPYVNRSRITKVVVVLQHCHSLSLVNDLHIHVHVYRPWLHVHALCIQVHTLCVLFFVHVHGDFLL